MAIFAWNIVKNRCKYLLLCFSPFCFSFRLVYWKDLTDHLPHRLRQSHRLRAFFSLLRLRRPNIFCNLTRIRYSSSTSFYISDWRAPGMATSLDRWASGNTTLMSIKVSLIISSPLMSYWRVPCCTTFLWASLVCGLCREISKELSLNVNSWDWSF